MNTDTKALSKILSSHIQQSLKSLLYHDQLYFSPGMQGQFKFWKSVNVIQHINKGGKAHDYLKRIFFKKHLTKFDIHLQVSNRNEFFHLINGVHKIPLANVIND